MRPIDLDLIATNLKHLFANCRLTIRVNWHMAIEKRNYGLKTSLNYFKIVPMSHDLDHTDT